MKSKRFIASGLACLLSLAALTSCGGSAPSGGAQNTATTAAATKTTAGTAAAAQPSGKKITISYLNWNGGEEMRLQKEFFDKYMKDNPNIDIQGQWVTEGYEAKINTLVAANQTPDIYYINEYLASEWGEKGIATDLIPLFSQAVNVNMQDRYVSNALFGTNGKIYGLATGPVCLLLYYYKPLFDKAGVSYPSTDANKPWTWKEFVDAAIKLTSDTAGNHPGDSGFKPGQIKTYGANAPSFWLMTMPLLYSNNASYGGADGMGNGLEAPEAKDVIKSIADLILVNQVSPDAAIAKNLPGMTQLFKNEQMAMSISGTWEYQNFISENVEFGVAPLPMFSKPSNISWAACNQIAASSKNQMEAAKLLYSLADCENNPLQLQINFPNVKSFYTDSAKSGWLDKGNYKDDFKKIIPVIMSSIAVQPENVTLKNFNKLVNDIAQAELDKVYAGTETVDQAVANITAQTDGQWQGKW